MAPVRKRPFERLLDGVVAHAPLLAVVLLAAGYAGLAALPLLERRISFDENALLAGSARPTIRTHSAEALTAASRLASTLSPHFSTPKYSEKLQRAMTRAGLEAYEQAFAVDRPGGGGELRCTNLHAVLRSPRGDGKEALVLVTPVTLQPFITDFNQTAAGASLVVSLAHGLLAHLRAVPWLAKDVMWVVADASCGLTEATAAWVAEYTQTPPPRGVRLLPGSAPFGRAGLLQQGVVLEATDGTVAALEIPLPGYDGQLPKLDMYWLVRHYTSAWVATPHAGDPPPAPPAPLRAAAAAAGALAGPEASVEVWEHGRKVGAVARFAWQQARGLPLGPHAAFKAASADAVTLRMHGVAPPGTVNSDGFEPLDAASALQQLSEALELTLRSCSVLVERFHHSFFLYVLVTPRTFLSVEQYIGVVVVLALVPVTLAAAIKRREDEALGQDPSPPRLSKDRTQWGAAARAVLLAHAACAGIGALLREGPSLAAGGGLAGWLRLATAGSREGGAGLQGAAAGAALLLAVGLGEAAQCVRQLVKNTSRRRQQQQQQNGGKSSSSNAVSAGKASWRRKLAVVELSAAAAVLAALACVNWALAYAAAAVLAPLAIAACGPSCGGDSKGGSGGSSSSSGFVFSAAAWVLASPPALLAAAYSAAGHAPAVLLQHQQVQWLLYESSGAAYAVWWGLYLPFWLICGYVSLCTA